MYSPDYDEKDSSCPEVLCAENISESGLLSGWRLILTAWSRQFSCLGFTFSSCCTTLHSTERVWGGGPLEKAKILLFASFETVRSAKISISTSRGLTSGGTCSFLRKNLLNHCIQIERKTWKYDLKMSFEHQHHILTSFSDCSCNRKMGLGGGGEGLQLYWFFENIANSRNWTVSLRHLQSKLPNQTDTGRPGHFYEFQRSNIVR